MGILCPRYYYLPTRIFRPSYGPALQQEMIFPLSCLRDSTWSKLIPTRPSQSNTSVDMSAVIARLARVTSWNMDVWWKIYILIRILVLSGCPESRPINYFLGFQCHQILVKLVWRDKVSLFNPLNLKHFVSMEWALNWSTCVLFFN